MAKTLSFNSELLTFVLKTRRKTARWLSDPIEANQSQNSIWRESGTFRRNRNVRTAMQYTNAQTLKHSA